VEVGDDESLIALLSRLLAEALPLGERAVKDVAFAAAKRRGWPSSPSVNAIVNKFLARFNREQAKANPKRVLPFLEELEGWLVPGRDLLFYAS
jgi:hypothetical protein